LLARAELIVELSLLSGRSGALVGAQVERVDELDSTADDVRWLAR
jgi:hypothetical protein